jgi:uncharacterized membrane protein
MAMPELMIDMLRAMNDPVRLHAALVHTPIALAGLGLLLVIALVCTGGKWSNGRWFCVVVYAIAAGVAWYAAEAGAHAWDKLDLSVKAALPDAAHQTLDNHEWYGGYAWWWLAGMAVVVALTAVPVTAMRTLTLVLAILGGLGTTGWIMITAHHGGDLVYTHSINVPSAPVTTPPDTAETVPPDEEPSAPADDQDTDNDKSGDDGESAPALEKPAEPAPAEDQKNTPADTDPSNQPAE